MCTGDCDIYTNYVLCVLIAVPIISPQTPKSNALVFLFVGSLQIRHSQESDEGKYECVAENNNGVAYSYGANLYVRGTYGRHTWRPV